MAIRASTQHEPVKDIFSGRPMSLTFSVENVATLSGMSWTWRLWKGQRPQADTFQGWQGSAPVLSKTSGAGQISATLDDTTATVTVTIAEGDTAGFKGLYYDELVVDGGGSTDAATASWGNLEFRASGPTGS